VFEAMPRQFRLAPVAATDHALAGDHLGGDAPLFVQRMPLAAVQPVLLAVQRLVDQPVHAYREGTNGQVQARLQHALLQLVRTHHRQIQVHAGMLLAEGADHLGQGNRPFTDHRIEDAELESAGQFALERGGIALELVQFGEDAQGFLVQQLALGGQREAAATAMAEGDAELGFQLAHVGADRRGRQVEFLLRGGEALLADHRDEHPQQLEIGLLEGHGKPRRPGRRRSLAR